MKSRIGAVVAVAGLAAVTLTACSSGPAAPDEAVTIDYWSGIAGTDEAVTAYNDLDNGTTVKWSDISGSTDEQVAKLTAALQADEAPCLIMMQNDRIPSLLANGAFQEVTEITSAYAEDYYEGTWDGVTYGGASYGVPSDTGPMAMFYRADLFDEAGIDVPTTWDEFAAASAAVTAATPGTYLTGISADDANGLFSLVAQSAPAWFSIEDDAWNVDVDSAESQDIVDYWQGLLDDGLLNTTKRWDPTFYNDLSEGRQLAVLGGAWQAPLIAGNVTGGAGSWAVAPLPTWDGVAASAGNGGSSILVTSSCENPKEALDFAHWLTTDIDREVAMGLFPAAVSDSVPTDAAVKEFFGGTEVNDQLAEIATTVKPGWGWSPTWSSAQPTITDGMNAAVDGTSTLSALLTAIQAQQIESLTDAGISVTE